MTIPSSKPAFLLMLLVLLFTYIKAQEEKKAITLSAYTEVYYLYNFNKPSNNAQPPFIYNFNRSNEVNLNLGYAKGSYHTDKIRANFALMSGTYTQANLAAEPEVLRHILEANIGVKLSAKSNLWLDAGILPSHIGFESATGKDSYNLTRSLLAENSPYYEAGVKLGYTSKNEQWFLSALFLNGWQRIKRPDGNTTPAFGTQVTFKATPAIILNSSTFVGNNKPDSARLMRYFHNFYSICQVTQKWSAIVGFDIGIEQKSIGISQMNMWYSPVLIAKYQSSGKLSLSARTEYYSDKNGVLIKTNTRNGFQTFGISANADYAIEENVLWRIEARALISKDNIFETGSTISVSNSIWLTSSVCIAF